MSTLGIKYSKESRAKMSAWQIGRTLSSRTRAKISASKTGVKIGPFSESHRLKISLALKGKQKSLRARVNMSIAAIGKAMSNETLVKMSEARRGDKNPNWQGGLTTINHQIRNSLEYRQWRKSVFERDGYACVLCGDDRGGNLEADHIKPFALFPSLRLKVDNGRTLCESCHKETDTYGYKTTLLLIKNHLYA